MEEECGVNDRFRLIFGPKIRPHLERQLEEIVRIRTEVALKMWRAQLVREEVIIRIPLKVTQSGLNICHEYVLGLADRSFVIIRQEDG
jgi:hypothetical protein